jgi:hypothetical protein
MQIKGVERLNLFKTPSELLNAILVCAYSRGTIEAAVGCMVDSNILRTNENLANFNSSSVTSSVAEKKPKITFDKKLWDDKYLYGICYLASKTEVGSIYLHADEVIRHLVKKANRRDIIKTVFAGIGYGLIVFSPFIIASIISYFTKKNGGGGDCLVEVDS